MTVSIVSLKFSPGHIAHLKAYRELFSIIADEVKMFLSPQYRSYIGEQRNIIYTTNLKSIKQNSDLTIVYNFSLHNILLGLVCKQLCSRIIYILHEPNCGINEVKSEGKDTAKMIAVHLANMIICKEASKVILASEAGMKNYEKNMGWINKEYALFPLILPDMYESQKKYKRKYFSFVGGFIDSHACDRFLQFMEYALHETDDMKFLIATKTSIKDKLEKKEYKKAIAIGRLVVQEGRPMTTEEINNYYRQSICVWNAYNRTTQSGVLPNALMQGTPVLVNKKGVAKEIMQDRTAGYFLSENPSNAEIMHAFRYIQEHISEMEKYAREIFEKKYFYGTHVETAKRIFFS